MAKVSIIIPVYNSEKYLKKCLDSVCSQTLADIEIIILNDASTDSSLNIIKHYEKSDSRIKVINMDSQLGPGALRNYGIQIANGEYIGFVDSDDYIEPNMYDELYRSIVDYDVDIASCGFIKEIFGIDYKKILGKTDRNLSSYSIIDFKKQPDFLSEASVTCWNKIYKHDFIQNFAFPEDLKFEDYPMVINMLGTVNQIISMQHSLYHYRLRPNSLTTSNDKVFQVNTLDIFECNERIRQYYTENGLLSIFEESLHNIFLMHCVFKLVPMLSVSMPFPLKKQLINYYMNLIDIHFNGWREDAYLQRKKESSIRLGPSLFLIDKLFLDDSMLQETDHEKVKQKIIDLCSKQKR